MFRQISPLYLNCQSKWEGEPFHFMITYFLSNGVYENMGINKLGQMVWIRHKCTQRHTHKDTHTTLFTQFRSVLVIQAKCSTISFIVSKYRVNYNDGCTVSGRKCTTFVNTTKYPVNSSLVRRRHRVSVRSPAETKLAVQLHQVKERKDTCFSEEVKNC